METDARSHDYNSFAFNAGRITGRNQRNSVVRTDQNSEINLHVEPEEAEQSPQQVLQRSVANPTTSGWHVGTEEIHPRMATGSEHVGCDHCYGNSFIRLHPYLSEDELSRADDIRTDLDLRNQFANSGNTRTWTSEHHSDASVTLRDDEIRHTGIVNLIRDGDDEDNVSDIFLSVPCAGRPAPRLRTRDF
jgi:hypothetical protein